MSDFHFVVRHALTGVVFLCFALAARWIAAPGATTAAFTALTSNRDVMSALMQALVPILFTAPVLGVAIQGICTTFLYSFGAAFDDEARQRIGLRIRKEILQQPLAGMDSDRHEQYCDAFQRMSNDPAFVWLYHQEAPAHLIEWARRRRSYHYLGMNWALAAALGLITGAVAPYVLHAPWGVKVALITVFFIAWVAGTCWLAMKMKQDVECMELTWACAQLYPEFKKSIGYGSLVGHTQPDANSPDCTQPGKHDA